MTALELIAAERAKPMTHAVLTTYADGMTKRHETRHLAGAETWAHLERQKMGKDLISRNADLEAGPIVRVVAVEILSYDR